MRRAWCTLPFLASTLLLVVSAFTDVQARPAQSAQASVSPREKGSPTHQESIAQSLPAPSGLSITASVAPQPPPPPREEMVPMAPLPSYVWMPGYWAWNSGWQWVPGRWVQPPRGATTWVPGQWVPQSQNWVWRPGRWQ